MIIRGAASEFAERIQSGDLIEAGGHNLLVYDELITLREIFGNCAKTLLPKNEIVVLASQYDSLDNLKRSLQKKGVNVAKHQAEGTLFIIDAQHGYQGPDTYGTFKLVVTLSSRAKKEGRRGITWLGDMGSFFAFDRIHDLVDYELSCPTKYEDTLKTVCCYHKVDFNSLDRGNKGRLIQHHRKSIFVDEK